MIARSKALIALDMSVGSDATSVGSRAGASVAPFRLGSAHVLGTNTRARPSLPGYFRQPCRRIRRSADATLILRTGVIQMPSVGSRSPPIVPSVGLRVRVGRSLSVRMHPTDWTKRPNRAVPSRKTAPQHHKSDVCGRICASSAVQRGRQRSLARSSRQPHGFDEAGLAVRCTLGHGASHRGN